VPGQRLPLPSGQSLRPRTCIPPRGYSSRGINGGSRDSPVRPAPRLWPPDGTAALGLSPVLRTPPLPAAHDRAGPGVSTRPELRDRHNRPSNPRVHSQSATSCRNDKRVRKVWIWLVVAAVAVLVAAIVANAVIGHSGNGAPSGSGAAEPPGLHADGSLDVGGCQITGGQASVPIWNPQSSVQHISNFGIEWRVERRASISAELQP
jgi:hypothetical protein